MFEGIFSKFVLDYAVKIIHSGLVAIVAKGLVTGQESTTLEAGAGILITAAINAGLKALQNKKIADANKKATDAVVVANQKK